jgi:hypothetical protein
VVAANDKLYVVDATGPTSTADTVQNVVNSALASPAAIGTGTPAAGTFTTLKATGVADGLINVTVTTAATTIDSAVQKTGYFINNGDSAAKGIYTLPTAAVGLSYCVRNYTALTGATAVITWQTSAAGQYIDLDGVKTGSGKAVKSAGGLADSSCVVGISTTEWIIYVQSGSWAIDNS